MLNGSENAVEDVQGLQPLETNSEFNGNLNYSSHEEM